MDKIQEYKTLVFNLSKTDYDDIDKCVNSWIDKGFQPFGYPITLHEKASPEMLVTMVFYRPNHWMLT